MEIFCLLYRGFREKYTAINQFNEAFCLYIHHVIIDDGMSR
jgi:hypothetical protein